MLIGGQGRDVVLCQITSQNTSDSVAVPITPSDVIVVPGEGHTGRLRISSNVRPNKLFTADESIVIYEIGILSADW